MNYTENKTHWNPGDLVIHDADAKHDCMLMRVVEYAVDGRCRTEYVNKDEQKRWNRSGEGPLLNRLAVLHDPKRFCLKHAQALEWGPCLYCAVPYTVDPVSGPATDDGLPYISVPQPGDVIGCVFTEGSSSPPTPIYMPAADEPRKCARCDGKPGGCWRCKFTGVTSPATDMDDR